MKVLCVDDDPFMLGFFEEAVKKLGLPHLEVLSAVSGKEAIDITENMRIDFIILDIRLPDISGIEVLRKIKRSLPLTEVLMVTGHASIEMVVEAMRAGARDFIEKPVQLALLQEKIRSIIELRERVTEAEEYRFVKKTIEAGGQWEIASIEEIINSIKQCKKRVMGIIESNRSDAEKVEIIKQEIGNFINKIE
jgi:DNA-binding NtrC family response regulator